MSGSKTFDSAKGDQSRRITTATTTVVAARTAVLKRIVVGTTAAGSITVNDGLTTRLVLKASIPAGVYEVNLLCPTKIEIVTAAASDITAFWE